MAMVRNAFRVLGDSVCAKRCIHLPSKHRGRRPPALTVATNVPACFVLPKWDCPRYDAEPCVTCRPATATPNLFKVDHETFSNASAFSSNWFHADRVASRHRDHCHSDRAVTSGRSTGPSRRQTCTVQEQHTSVGPGASQLPLFDADVPTRRFGDQWGGGGGGGGAMQGFARDVLRWWRCASSCAVAGINPPQTTCSVSCERKFQFSSPHEGGCHFAFADGHGCFVSENIDVAVFRALLTRSGGEVVGE